MALTRSLLKGLGLEDNQISTIIEAHTETVSGIRKEAESEQGKIQNRVTELEKELASAKSGGDDWEAKYNELEKQFTDFKNDTEAKANKNAKETAYTELLKTAGVSDKRIATILKVTDMSGITLNKDGTIREADKLSETIKEEWADFIVSTAQNGAGVPTPPAGKTTMTRAEIMAIKDTAKRQEAIRNNMELFE